MTDLRSDWPTTFMAMAVELARHRADCTRRKVAAIIYNPRNGDLIQCGYNGAAPGQPGCLSDGACLRGQHYEVIDEVGSDLRGSWKVSHCGGCGRPYPCADTVQPSSSYDTGPGTCIATHAEFNALWRAGKKARGKHMVITEEPCDGCLKLINAAQVRRVVTPTSVFDWPIPLSA